MTQEELKEQAETNKKRIVCNNLFVVAIIGVSLFAFLPVALLTKEKPPLFWYNLVEQKNHTKQK